MQAVVDKSIKSIEFMTMWLADPMQCTDINGILLTFKYKILKSTIFQVKRTTLSFILSDELKVSKY